ncbi:hypothetical protein [Pseudomonas savastanoi]|uniref:hypothetical protein n=2 Tax=Pseudomonas savastanoi TaxID=29438 RepID=UPI000F00269E|nr:hypothetical protein [Pseudomonas savastanoi]RMU23283.1 hypothetical protein ALP34_200143 [Pseudomonas savastanoi pv. glycinea]
MLPYTRNLKKNLWNFTISRLFPFFGISIAAALLAHKNIDDLPVFAYVLAIFSVVSTVFSMPLAAIGNIFHNKKKSLSAQEIFEDGFKIALVFSISSLVIAAIIIFFLSNTYSNGVSGHKLNLMSVCYVLAVPLLVINTFLHIFHESSDGSSSCAKIKRKYTLLGCLILLISYFFIPKEFFLYFAIGYFPIVETFILISLVLLSKELGYIFFIKKGSKIFHDILVLGFPIAAGLAGQKVYYYLLNEKLLSIKASLAGDLSICMSVIGCLLIPITAFSQMHSVYASKNKSVEEKIYTQGIVTCTILVAVISVALFIFGKPLFYIFGDGSLEFSKNTFFVVTLSIASSAYFMLTTSHLRSMNDTLTPQIIINVVMLAVLIPLIYFGVSNDASVYVFITMQATTVLIVTALLQFRVFTLNKRFKSSLSVHA